MDSPIISQEPKDLSMTWLVFLSSLRKCYGSKKTASNCNMPTQVCNIISEGAFLCGDLNFDRTNKHRSNVNSKGTILSENTNVLVITSNRLTFFFPETENLNFGDF